MKKVIVTLMIAFMAYLVPSTGLAYMEANDIILNGYPIPMDVRPIVVGGRTLVPMRAIFETLGYEVSWNEYSQTAIGQKYGSRIEFKIDSSFKEDNFYNGIGIEMDVSAKIYNGRTLVPVRLVSELAGLDVGWDGYNRNVILSNSYGKLSIDEAYRKVVEFDRPSFEELLKEPYAEFLKNIDFNYSQWYSSKENDLYIFQRGVYMTYSVNKYSGEVRKYMTYEM